jgi:predicted dehydrogenase/threonine dehydrogenase-like Zn-dependent dehydrogenase
VKQLLQDRNSGKISLEDVPAPVRTPAGLLIATRSSLISPGTERAAVELGTKSLVGKARSRPDLVEKVLTTAREEGPAATLAKVRGQLDHPNALGYSSSGIVLEAPADAPAGPGDLVACAGAGYAVHAEIVNVPRTLVARVPENVTPEDAAYATLAAIALHGVRLCSLQLGEVAVVVGLGLVGQLTLELVAASGCTAIGVDPSPARVALAREAGFWATEDADELVAEAHRLTAGRGADGALITAASASSAPLATGIAAARERTTVCMVGDVAVESSRRPLFEKELSLVVSRSYGPGRYDPRHEEGGIDYPAGYVRWTEGRNLEAVLGLMAGGALNPSRLTSHRFSIDQGIDAYDVLSSDEPSLGIVLDYGTETPDLQRTMARTSGRPRAPRRRIGSRRVRVGVIGAGSFARTVLLPHLAGDVDIVSVVTATGPSAKATATRFGAKVASTDPGAILDADDVDAVVIATRHDSHAELTARALEAGKHVFVEKPPAIDAAGLAAVELAARGDGAGTLMVGFNRRFAPLTGELGDALGGRGPLLIHYRVNAGRIPASHWTHDPEVGGGRIVGEACHFVDFVCALTHETPDHVAAVAVENTSEPREDTFAATLAFPGGSVASIVYSALGDTSLGKERVEVLGEAGAAVLDDFRTLTLHRHGSAKQIKRTRDKGHAAELDAFVKACRSGEPAQGLDEILGVMRATFDIRSAVSSSR